jgi:hypothetical protein
MQVKGLRLVKRGVKPIACLFTCEFYVHILMQIEGLRLFSG